MGLFKFFKGTKKKETAKDLPEQDQIEQAVVEQKPVEQVQVESVPAPEVKVAPTKPETIKTTDKPKDKPEFKAKPAKVAVDKSLQSTISEPKKTGLFGRLREKLSRTRKAFGAGLTTIVLGSKTIDDDLLEELETHLLTADVGIDATEEIIANLTKQVERERLDDPAVLMDLLKQNLKKLLEPCAKPLVIEKSDTPFVVLMVGVNGAGKTTTIGKLAKRFQSEGKSVMLAAGDTFRAAAVEQLQVWGERNNIAVVSQHTGADSASVVFDAVNAAKSRSQDVLLADTAGRLHTKQNLMEELKKVCRVMKKLDDTAPHETLLVLDASMGQNALLQAEKFHQAVGLTGIVITKLDGTAKGGVIFAIAKKLALPIRYIGVGESIEDLRPFDADAFVDALFVA